MKSWKRTGKIGDEFSRKRLLSVFRYCFGNVSGLFRDWCSFCKPEFRPVISRNHAPGFLISKGTKRLRETRDIICMIPNGSCLICMIFIKYLQIIPADMHRNLQIISDFLQFSLKFSYFLCFSQIFSEFL